MKTLMLGTTAALFLLLATSVMAANFTDSVSPSDGDGSFRLAYQSHQYSNKILELVLREKDGVVLARGFLPDGRISYEVYATLDLTTGHLIFGKGIFPVEPERLNGGFPTKYTVHPRCKIRVYSVDKSFSSNLKAFIAQYKEKGCHEELIKRFQGRNYDNAKCGDTDKIFNDVITALVQPDAANFQELTANVQYQRYIEKLRKYKDHYVIEEMEMALVDKLRDPKIQQELAVQKKKPAYLEEGKGIVEKTTVERYRY